MILSIGSDGWSADLFYEFLGRREYDRRFALLLRDVAVDPEASWPIRRLFTLLLEHTLLLGDDFGFWLRELGIDTLSARALRRKLERAGRVHRRLASAPSESSVADFLHLASRDCRLTLARWLWSPQETFARVDEAVRPAHGVRSRPDYGHRFVELESAEAVRSLPDEERDLVLRLGHKAVTRWVAPHTSSEINSLVEHPLGTVVLTVKPPGSDHEIEIKRAGIRGDFPLDVLYERDGYVLPPSHHLQGGSMEAHLGVEASHSSIMSRLYRLVHGQTAPMSRTIHLAQVFNVPSPIGDVDILDYFTDPKVFGERYRRMRGNMIKVTAELARGSKRARTEKHNELSLTLEFLGLVQPAQCVQIGTTSFRLERLGLYFGDDGAKRYFEQLGVEYTRDDARRFADELLDEILCVYEPPAVPYRSHRTYLAAALAVPANRKRADRNYVEVMTQIGRFWGTLLAPRGHSHGESFVSRNCGLRSVFEDGEWKIRMIYMDHDSLAFAARYENSYSPRPSIRAAMRDARFILGLQFGGQRPIMGEIDYLRDIYRISPAVERRGLAALRTSMKDAYDKTQQALLHNAEVRKMFSKQFLSRLTDWDEAVRCWTRDDKEWKPAVHATLSAKGYGPRLAAHFVEAIEKYGEFLEKVKFLF